MALLVFVVMAYQALIQDKTLFLNESNLTLGSAIADQLSHSDWQQANALLAKIHLTQGLVFDSQGKILASADKALSGKTIDSYVPVAATEKIERFPANEGSFEDQTLDGKNAIYNFVKIPTQAATLLLITPKDAAFRASLLFILKGTMILILFILIGGTTTIWFKRTITAPLSMIADHTENLAAGNLNVCLPDMGNDEFGKLGSRFNHMIQNLRKSNYEREEELKRLAEKELQKEQQKTLLPPRLFKSKHIEVAGTYQTLPQGTKDWWFYFQTQNHFVICVAQFPSSTQHPSLMASAARGTFAIISKNFQGPADAMETLKLSLLETNKASLETQCLIAAIDLQTGVLTYTNAGLDKPILILSESSLGLASEAGSLDYESPNSHSIHPEVSPATGTETAVETDSLMATANLSGTAMTSDSVPETQNEAEVPPSILSQSLRIETLEHQHSRGLNRRFGDYFKEDSLQLTANSLIFFHSNGVLNLFTSEARELETSPLHYWLEEAFEAAKSEVGKTSTVNVRNKLDQRMDAYLETHQSENDLSYFFVRWSSHENNS